MKSRIKTRKGAILNFERMPHHNYVDEVLRDKTYTNFSRVFNEAEPTAFVTKKMTELYEPLIAAFSKIPENEINDFEEKLKDISLISIKINHHHIDIELSDAAKKLLPKEAQPLALDVIKQATAFSFSAIYDNYGNYQSDFVDFMKKSFKRPYCLAEMEQYAEEKGQSLERDLISSAGLYIASLPQALMAPSNGTEITNIFANNVLNNTFQQYSEACFEIINRTAEKDALRKVCDYLQVHFLEPYKDKFSDQQNQDDADEMADFLKAKYPHDAAIQQAANKVSVLTELRNQLDIKGLEGLRAFGEHYLHPTTSNALLAGSDSTAITILKAVRDFLASIFSLGLYPATRAYQSQKKMGTMQFWLTPEKVLAKNAKKHVLHRDLQAPPFSPAPKKTKR